MIRLKTLKQVAKRTKAANQVEQLVQRASCNRALIERKPNGRQYKLALFELSIMNKYNLGK